MVRTRLLAVFSLAALLSLLLALVSGCSSDSDSPTGSSTITVSGRVVDGQRRPVPNAPVVITGLPAVTSNANGAFSIAGVTPPYDITVVISSTKLGITYRGLTRSDPTLVNLFSSSPATNNATISGTVSGGAGYPLPANHTSSVVYVSPEASGGSTPSSGTGTYSLNLSWDGISTTTGTLHALQWETSGTGMPLAYKGYATKAGVIVSNGGSFPNQNLPMASVTSGTISGTITVPGTVTLAAKVLSLAFSSTRSISLGSESGAAAAFTYTVPNVTGTTITLGALGSGAGGQAIASKTGILVGASGVALTLPEVPQLSLPVNAASNVTNTTPFSWTTHSSMVYIAYFFGPANEPIYLVVVGTASTTIPDLTSLGLGLPASAGYTWYLIMYGPNASIDAAAGTNGIVPLGDSMGALSSTRSFTTAP